MDAAGTAAANGDTQAALGYIELAKSYGNSVWDHVRAHPYAYGAGAGAASLGAGGYAAYKMNLLDDILGKKSKAKQSMVAEARRRRRSNGRPKTAARRTSTKAKRTTKRRKTTTRRRSRR